MINKQTLMTASGACLAASSLCGVALQAAGLYLSWLIILYVLFTHTDELSPKAQSLSRSWIIMGMCLMGVYLLYPVFQALQFYVKPFGFEEFSELLVWKTKLLKRNPLTSAVMVFGGLLVIAGLILESKPRSSSITPPLRASHEMKCFVKGFHYGIVVMSLVALTFSFFREGLNGLRAEAFFHHPLGLASVALIWIAFYGYLIVEFFCRPKLFASRVFAPSIAVCSIIFAAQLALLALSLSRMALLCAVLVCAVYLTWVLIYGQASKQLKYSITVGSAVLLAFGVWMSWGRVEEFFKVSQLADVFGNRLHFWKVHWQIFTDSPWIGQGHSYLRDGLRLMYYENLELGGLSEKYNAHNLYLEALVSVGVIGVGVCLVLLVKLVKNLNEISSPYHLSLPKIALFSCVFINLLHGLTQNTFYDSNVAYSYLSLMSLFVLMSYSHCLIDKASGDIAL